MVKTGDAFYSFSDIKFMDLSTGEIADPQAYKVVALPVIPEGENETFSMEDFYNAPPQTLTITLTRQSAWVLQAMFENWPVTYTCREGWNRHIQER